VLVALTGTPGVGKSTVADILRKRGYRVFSVNVLAEKFKCIIGEEEGCKVVDVEELSKKVKEIDEGITILEGHLSHLLKPDVTIVLRCNPIILKNRLESKKWNREKILENVEAEIVDSILIESIENCRNVYEVDTTELDPEEVADIVEEIIKRGNKRFKPGRIDWISEIGDRIDEFIRKT